LHGVIRGNHEIISGQEFKIVIISNYGHSNAINFLNGIQNSLEKINGKSI